MKVLLTTEAEGDLERIGDYIALDNPRRALSFVLELRDACMSLANLHLAFPLVSRYAHSGIRRRVHEKYLIFYRIEAEHVVIIHVLYGAIDYTSVLFPQEKNNVLG